MESEEHRKSKYREMRYMVWYFSNRWRLERCGSCGECDEMLMLCAAVLDAVFCFSHGWLNKREIFLNVSNIFMNDREQCLPYN